CSGRQCHRRGSGVTVRRFSLHGHELSLGARVAEHEVALDREAVEVAERIAIPGVFAVDAPAWGFGEGQLRNEQRPLAVQGGIDTGEDLEVAVRIPTPVAAWHDQREPDPPLGIRRLQASQVVLSGEVVERVGPCRVVLPQVDRAAGERGTAAGFDEVYLELERYALGASGHSREASADIAPDDPVHRQHVYRPRAPVAAVGREGAPDLCRRRGTGGACLCPCSPPARADRDTAQPEREAGEHPSPVELELAGHVVASAIAARASAPAQSYPPATRQTSLPSAS